MTIELFQVVKKCKCKTCAASITTANKENKFSLLRLQRRRINRQRQEATHEAVKTSRGGIGACAPTPNVHSPPRIGYRLSRRYH